MPAELSPRTIPMLAITCGFAAANAHFPQALTPLIADGIGVTPSAAAGIVTASQFGCGTGIFLLTPLGDRLVQRWLIVALLSVAATGLLVSASASTLPILLAASMTVGAATAVPSIIIAMAAGTVRQEQRGAVTGLMLGGVAGGIAIARAFAGLIGEWLDWRAPYLIAAVATGVAAVVLAIVLPTTDPRSREPYSSLVRTTIRLLRTIPRLRRSAFGQAVGYAGFTAAWTSVVLFLAGPDYGLDGTAIGLVALVGVVAVIASPIIGRRIDRFGRGQAAFVSWAVAVTAGVILLLGCLGGVLGLVGLVAGMLLLDTATRTAQVSNQAAMLDLRPDARSRINSAFMTCMFLGGAAGSVIGVHIFNSLGWVGVCLLIALLPGISLTNQLLENRRFSQQEVRQ